MVQIYTLIISNNLYIPLSHVKSPLFLRSELSSTSSKLNSSTNARTHPPQGTYTTPVHHPSTPQSSLAGQLIRHQYIAAKKKEVIKDTYRLGARNGVTGEVGVDLNHSFSKQASKHHTCLS